MWHFVVLILFFALLPLRAQESKPVAEVSEPGGAAGAFEQEVPPSTARITMLPVPGTADGAIRPFWMSRTEITWDVYDVFAYRLDEQAGLSTLDAITRPTKPHVPPDRGYGHAGYAAISVTKQAAVGFCKWLSARSGRSYRLPTETEWEYACRGGLPSPYASGEDPAKLHDFAWFAANSKFKPRHVGRKQPNGFGLLDIHGNVAEWCEAKDGKPVAKGGSFRDKAEALAASSRALQDRSWNATDPNIPKSPWWLSDAPFVGFRIVCDGPTHGVAESKPEDHRGKGR